MRIGGLQKLTLLDFPGHVACTVFLQGCNFRCPFCHNTPLVLSADPPQAEAEILGFLQKRQGLLDGVAITGGEPLLTDIAPFLRRIKALGYPVKLDTNGSFPDRLRALLGEKLVDYVAMDIKNSREKYAATAGVSVPLSAIEQSIALLREGTVPYEFRTTVVDELHEPEDFTAIGQWLRGAEAYFLQAYVDSGDILQPGLHAASREKMEQCLANAGNYIENVHIRGMS